MRFWTQLSGGTVQNKDKGIYFAECFHQYLEGWKMSPFAIHATAPSPRWCSACVRICTCVQPHQRATPELCRRPGASLGTEQRKAAQWPEKPAAHHLHTPGITAWIREGWNNCELRDYLTIQDKWRKKEKPFPVSLSLISHSPLCLPMSPCLFF